MLRDAPMANRVDLTREQFVKIAQIQPLRLCSSLLQQEELKGVPRVVETGLLPDKKPDGTVIEAWVWDDGLCLVSPAIWGLLGGT